MNYTEKITDQEKQVLKKVLYHKTLLLRDDEMWLTPDDLILDEENAIKS